MLKSCTRFISSKPNLGAPGSSFYCCCMSYGVSLRTQMNLLDFEQHTILSQGFGRGWWVSNTVVWTHPFRWDQIGAAAAVNNQPQLAVFTATLEEAAIRPAWSSGSLVLLEDSRSKSTITGVPLQRMDSG